MKGLVLKKQSTLFEVQCGEGKLLCSARGNLKKEGIFVGDFVEVNQNERNIESVCNRKNCLIRPPISNLDKMFIVISPKPKPDFYLVDKLLLFCVLNDIEPLLCLNKVDIDNNFAEEVKKIYQKDFEIVECSAKLNMTDDLKKSIKGICAFAGQSAVGKSSLINSIFGKQLEDVGDFGKRVERGKQTTRVVSLYPFGDGFIADTAGFSQLDERLIDVDERELSRYYPDFYPYVNECKYQTCEHISDKDCSVCKAVEKGAISKIRYQNYLKLLEAKKMQKKY